MKEQHYLAFDCGNSSLRTVVGRFDGHKIELEVLRQVPNQEFRGVRFDHWNILSIFHELLRGMEQACSLYPDITTFGISTWGIDFGLIGASGDLLGNPLSYRNSVGMRGMKQKSSRELEQLFQQTGIQNLPMNSLYQLLGIRALMPEYLQQAHKVLLTPDLLNYLFTGEMNTEISIASTTELLDMRRRDYSDEVLSAHELDKNLFAPLVGHGKKRGVLKEELQKLYDIPPLIAVSVPSHDTASAVASVPSEHENSLWISSGTWSLIGTVVDEPIINRQVMEAGFSNEGGLHGAITLLKNSAGMHLMQRIKRELEAEKGEKVSWDQLVAMAQASKKGSRISFDVNDESLYHPVSMMQAIGKLTKLNSNEDIIASAYYALAHSYEQALSALQQIIGKQYNTLHIIGGGSQNSHVNALTASLTGMKVLAGPVEATSMGAIAAQLMYTHPQMSVESLRSVMRNSCNTIEYEP
ncbi:MAG: rhamnulokinase [Sphaerochaetaceae bacterium]